MRSRVARNGYTVYMFVTRTGKTGKRVLQNGTKGTERNGTNEQTLRNGMEPPVRSAPVQRPFNLRSIAVHIPFSLNGHPVAQIQRGELFLPSIVPADRLSTDPISNIWK